MAYKLDDGTAYSHVMSPNEDGYVDLRQLSPFLLLKPNDVPNPMDFKTLLDSKSNGRPFPVAVAKELRNTNPRVRRLATKLLNDLVAHPALK